MTYNNRDKKKRPRRPLPLLKGDTEAFSQRAERKIPLNPPSRKGEIGRHIAANWELPPDIITGKNPVIEALKAGRPLNRILLAKGIRSDASVNEIISLARHRGIPVEFVEKQAIERQSPGIAHTFGKLSVNQGVIAFTAAKDYVDLEDLLDVPAKTGEAALFCVLDGVEDPMNLGAVLRTAGATGVQGVIVRSRRAVDGRRGKSFLRGYRIRACGKGIQHLRYYRNAKKERHLGDGHRHGRYCGFWKDRFQAGFGHRHRW
jgi:hypothetical protein